MVEFPESRKVPAPVMEETGNSALKSLMESISSNTAPDAIVVARPMLKYG